METIDLEVRNVRLPSDKVGMVIAQPFVPDDSLSPAEPYQCTAEAKVRLLAMLSKTLTLSRAAHHGASKTHFTIFPEYSIPGPSGIALIDAAVRAADWPDGTIVIGGTDGLTRTQYASLLQGEATHFDAQRNGPEQVGDRWVNCVITWVKHSSGTVERWVQPKVHPAWPEMNIAHQHMFNGRCVYVFKGRFENNAPFRFATLICFDWIATVGSNTPFQWILRALHNEANGAQLPLSWLFVVQRNQKPSHDTFLSSVNKFFNQTEFPNALRERACVVFSNTAGKAVPGRTDDFGGCSVVSSPQSLFVKADCVPTFSGGGPRYRNGSNLLASCKDFVFRERGACIHSFAQVNPGSVIAGASGRAFAVDEAHVFPISGSAHPRAPNAAVPAAVKWINDELDGLKTLRDMHEDAALAASAVAAHTQNSGSLRTLSSQALTEAIKLATEDYKSKNADEWDSPESAALYHLIHTLDILNVAFTPPPSQITGDPVHASIEIRSKPMDLLAVRGATHHRCVEHAKNLRRSFRRQTLLVSRDLDNTKWLSKFGSFLEPRAHPGEEPRITDPSAGLLHLGYQNILGCFLSASDPATLATSVYAEFDY